jgi:DNA-binding transcriptional MerR regulator
MSEDIDLATLAERAGVSQRTVRYYIQTELLPSPGKGPNARYDASLVDRLRLIKEYQDQGLPLSRIRDRLEELDENGIRAALGKPLELPLSDQALDYVRKAGMPEPDAKVDVVRPAPPELFAENRWQITQSNWERTKLTRNVELNVRRPLTPRENKLVDKLLEAARKIFAEEQ